MIILVGHGSISGQTGCFLDVEVLNLVLQITILSVVMKSIKIKLFEVVLSCILNCSLVGRNIPSFPIFAFIVMHSLLSYYP